MINLINCSAFLEKNMGYSDGATNFICDCGKYWTFVVTGKWTKPCPNCGKEYKGLYRNKKVDVIKMKPRSLGMSKILVSDIPWMDNINTGFILSESCGFEDWRKLYD